VSTTGSCHAGGYSGVSAFLCLVYEDLLGRLPDQGGLATFLGQLSFGTSRAQVAYEIATSSEYQGDLVGAIYEKFLGRPPDGGGLATFMGLLGSGASDQQVISDVVGSPEFFADAGGTDTGFVTLSYETILGRAPDAGGLATFLGLLESGTTPSEVADDLLTSSEFKSDTVSYYYEHLFGRAPDSSGLITQLGLLDSGASIEQFIAGIVGSPEFYDDATS
jgi:hypothetical protein